jgi:hypothetical protein
LKKQAIIDKLPEINKILRRINKELSEEHDDYNVEIDEDIEYMEAEIDIDQEDIN